MIRDSFRKHSIGMNKEFRHRGEEPGRLENFSDALFALAITLLLISTSPPNNFMQVKRFVIDLIPFIICVTFLVLIWHEHFVFYYRYGLRNAKMITLNALFLALVLFYVYPLKFLTKLIKFPISYVLNDDVLFNELRGMISGNDMQDLMIIYGFGAASVFFVLVLMYRYALKNAVELELNEIEIFDTRVSIRTNLLMGIVPIVSVLMAVIFYGHWRAGMIAGFTYFLYPIVMFSHGKYVKQARIKLLQELESRDSNSQLSA